MKGQVETVAPPAAVRFHPMNTAAGSFPRPCLPVLPVPSARRDASASTHTPVSAFDDDGCIALCSARAAIALALRLLGIGSGQRVLIPAYHCASMVEPVLWAGAEPVFFRLDRALRADLDDIQRGLRAGASAVLVSHYFGVLQPMRELMGHCRSQGIPVIEDCAHAIYGITDTDLAVGTVGDLAVASLPKFFPTLTGGVLRVNRGKHAVRLRQPSIRRELRALLEPLESAIRYRRGGATGRAIGRLLNVAPIPEPELPRCAGAEEATAGQAARPVPLTSYHYFHADEVGMRAALATRVLWRRADRAQLVAARRANWAALVDGLSGMSRARVLWDALPGDAVPYMLPLLLSQPEPDFVRLKRLAIPLWRWEDIAETDCPVSNEYRRALLHVPCHQALAAEDVRWLVAALRSVLADR